MSAVAAPPGLRRALGRLCALLLLALAACGTPRSGPDPAEIAAPPGEDPEGSGQGELIGYVASRAHHAEIGGVRPGSMPPSATRLIEEGVVIPPTHVVRGGEAQWDAMRELLTAGPHPTRAIEDNLADLRAAVTADLEAIPGARVDYAKICDPDSVAPRDETSDAAAGDLLAVAVWLGDVRLIDNLSFARGKDDA